MKKIIMHIWNFLMNRNKEPIIALKGIYNSWEEAQAECDGYDSEIIWDKVKCAVDKVKSGEAAFERDGFAFIEPHYNYPVLSFLLQRYIEDGKLHILDFGGSLGSMYYQHRDVMKNMSDLKWNIVEQFPVVDYGKKNLEDEKLLFCYDIDDVELCNFIIVGSSIQYINNYMLYLNKLVSKKVTHIVFDKIPVSNQEWISIEVVHEPIYEASYPIRVFDKEKLIDYMKSYGYEVEQSWLPEYREQFIVNDREVIFRSFAFKLCDK